MADCLSFLQKGCVFLLHLYYDNPEQVKNSTLKPFSQKVYLIFFACIPNQISQLKKNDTSFFCNLLTITMQTDQNKTLMRKSGRLPKLSMQQKLDNQEVADRMNRKVGFTRNPRHLNHTLSYAQALNTSPPQSTSQLNSTPFRVEPSEVHFTDYDTHHVYQAEARLVNHSKHTQRIKVTPLQYKEFTISSIKYPKQNSGDIAPGMAVTVIIRFRPPTLNDYEDALIVVAGEGMVRVPIIARRQRCELNWPKLVDCQHCWVGDTMQKEIVLHNRGGQACFNLVDVDSNKQSHQLGFFTISPTLLNFQRNSKQKIKVVFAPEQQGNFTETVKFKCDSGDQEEISVQVKGGAYSAQIVLSEINGEPLLEQPLHSTLPLLGSEMGVASRGQVKLKNLAVVQVDYFWHWSSKNLTITKSKGKMKPSQVLEFGVELTPTEIIPESHRLQLYLHNLPPKSLVGNLITKNIGGIEAIQCLSVEVVTQPSLSKLQVYPLHRQIVHPIYWQCRVGEIVTIANHSPQARTFRIERIKQDEGVESECRQTEGSIPSNSTLDIEVSFHLTALTSVLKTAWFLVSFDNAHSQIFSLSGQSTYPDLKLSTDLLYYGLCKTYSLHKRTLTLTNTQTSPVDFIIHNPHRFYHLDFYDFYDFEDESSYKPRLNFYHPATKKEMIEWCTVPPQSEIEVECMVNCMDEESIELEVEVEVRDGGKKKVQVVAEANDVHASMSREQINLKEIYKGNLYNSNKFLNRELRICNQGHHACTFQIEQPAFEQCQVRIEPLTGVIPKHSHQRIDLILQPIKTGDFDLNIKWKFYDNYKVNPHNYPQIEQQITYNEEEGRKSLVKERSLNLVGTIKGMSMNYYLKDESRAKKVRQKVEDFTNSVKMSATSFTGSMSSSKQAFFENEKLIYPMLEELNFYNCEINQVKQVQIIIENDSGLTTEYQVQAQKYHSMQKGSMSMGKKSRGLIKVQEEPFSSEMGRTFIKDRMLDRSQKVHLGNNKGISVLCEPSEGILYKKQSQKILITLFNDTSGRFQDNLLIKVKDHETKKIPMDIFIRGTPINLSRNQLGINFNQEVPLMNFGAVLPANGLVKKTIKVVNNGPKQARLQWHVYPYDKPSPNQDIFNIDFGQAAPGSGDLLELKWHPIKPQPDQNACFTLQPREKVVKGREEAVFTVVIQEVQQAGFRSNLLICEPILVQTGAAMQSLALVAKVEAVQPCLTMDVEHKNHINKLQRFAVAHTEYQTNVNNHIRRLKLKNTINSNLTFQIAVQSKDPKQNSFSIVNTKTNSPVNQFVKDPSTQRAFVLAFDTFLEVEVELRGNPSKIGEWPMEEKVRKDGKLTIDYSNGTQQVVELVGWLYRPWMQILMPNDLPYSPQNCFIDFGTVHVKNNKKISVYLINPSMVDSKWSVNYIKYHQSIKYKFQQTLWTPLDYQDQSIADEKKCWRLSSEGGVVKNKTLPVHYMPNTLALPNKDDKYAQNHRPVQLTFMFKPQANILYKSKFRISVIEGLSFDIVVCGRGTYEEELEQK